MKWRSSRIGMDYAACRPSDLDWAGAGKRIRLLPAGATATDYSMGTDSLFYRLDSRNPEANRIWTA